MTRRLCPENVEDVDHGHGGDKCTCEHRPVAELNPAQIDDRRQRRQIEDDDLFNDDKRPVELLQKNGRAENGGQPQGFTEPQSEAAQ